jgi:hypothetical protein
VRAGHARLSIIDLAGGAQPMIASERDGRGPLAVTFNGEIFNYIELRDELEAKGHRFTSKSDTEVILHAYAEWGDACVERMNGQWAVAVWDPRARRLFCSRDRIGKRPFFWAVHDGALLFASEVKALFAMGTPRSLDARGLHEVLTFWCTVAPRTVWRGVAELPPGSNLVVELDDDAPPRVNVSRYWAIDYNRVANGLRSLGVQRGDRVAVCLEGTVECVTSIFGVLKAGAAAVMMNPGTKSEKLGALLADAEASALVVGSGKLDALGDALDGCGALRAAVVTGTSTTMTIGGVRAVPFASVALEGDAAPPERMHDEDDLALLLYTSGSTGKPKGVMHGHHGLVCVTRAIGTYLGTREDDVILQVLPLSFGYGLTQLFTTFAAGATLVLEKSFAFPQAILQRLAAERAPPASSV